MTFEESVAVVAAAATECARRFADGRLQRAVEIMGRSPGRAILICGNGGSAADAAHFTAELLGRFRTDRPGIPAINLAADSAFLTAWSNDRSYDDVFARQVRAYRALASCLICISVSGESLSVVKAATAAAKQELPVISLTGEGGGKLKHLSEVLLDVPGKEPEFVQPLHQLVYHHLVGELEARMESR